MGWHFGVSLNWKAKKYTVSYPNKNQGQHFLLYTNYEVGTSPWAMSLVAALVAFQFQPLGLGPRNLNATLRRGFAAIDATEATFISVLPHPRKEQLHGGVFGPEGGVISPAAYFLGSLKAICL